MFLLLKINTLNNKKLSQLNTYGCTSIKKSLPINIYY